MGYNWTILLQKKLQWFLDMQTYGNPQKRAKESKIQVVMDEFHPSKIGTLKYNSIENWKQIKDR